MISPGERFNAFSGHRMSKKGEGASFEIANRHVVSSERTALFTFFHLLNRTVTNVPWVFWLQIIMSFIQLAIAVLSPFCDQLWEQIKGMKAITRILVIILRYIPVEASFMFQLILFY